MFMFLIVAIIILIFLCVYIAFNFHKFNVVRNIENKSIALSWFVASIPILILIIIGLWYLMYSAVIIIHLSFMFFICNIIGSIVKKMFKINTKRYIAGIMAIVLTTCYFVYGWQVAHNVVETDYKITSEKLSAGDSLRIVQITDSHIGTTFSGKGFEKYIDEISACNPDVIVFTGDFVDGITTYEDMVDGCESLGKAKSKYGTYFIFGNHDLDVYGRGGRYYTDEELLNELKKNNINVLQDESVLIDNKFYICGRQDFSVMDRKSTEELLSEVDKSKFTLLLDHQPIEYKEAEENGAVKFNNQAQFNPLKFLSVIAEELTIYENTKAIEIDEHKVVTDKGTITAEHIVIATHYPIMNTPGYYFLKMHQERSYVLGLENAGNLDGMYIDMDEDGYSFRTYKNLILFGGASHRTGENDKGEEYEKLRRDAKIVYPQAKERYHWSAQDCTTIDKIPYIGRYSDKTPHIYVATGFNKWGMTSSMVSAMIISDMINGIENEFSDIFSPDRFDLSSSVKNIAKDMSETTVNFIAQKIYIPKSHTDNIQNGHGGIVEYNGEKYGVYKNKDGREFFVSTKCSHLGCQLHWNPDELTWDCPCHGSRFDYTGKRIDSPAIKDIGQE